MNTDKQPLVSICCISYNHAKYIDTAINSFWKQKYKNIEILALDDGSSDESLSILQELQKRSPCPMQIIGQENTGRISYNFNKLLKLAKGKYCGIISLDDYLYDTAISEKIPLMEANSNCMFVFNSAITVVDENSIPYQEDHLSLFGKKSFVNDIIENEYNMDWTYYCQGTFYRKDILQTVGYLDEDLLADDYALRIKTALYLQKHPEKFFLNLDNPACFYRRHTSNISRNVLRQTLLIGEVLDRYYPDRKRPYEYQKLIKAAVPYMNFMTFQKVNMFKGETKILLKELVMFSYQKIRNMRKQLVRIRLSKNKKLIRLLGITLYQKGMDNA